MEARDGALLLAGALVGALVATALTARSLQQRPGPRCAKRRPSLSKAPRSKTSQQEMQASPAPSGAVLDGCRIEEIRLHRITQLGEHFESANVPNGMRHNSETSDSVAIEYNKIMSNEDFIIRDVVRKRASKPHSDAFVRAGPRALLHFDPNGVTAAVVTCGGLCPGLNNVIREVVQTLHYNYGVKRILGIRGGYAGFCSEELPPIELTPEVVSDIHHEGGTVLASSRGSFDIDKIISFLERERVTQLFVVGGDGTHRGAFTISEECIRRQLNVAVAGIPKTIDNDVDLIDRSFGFQTSVEAAQAAIRAAKTEARCNLPNGIGIVKLMGRSSGFIAVHATLASGDVDLCLVPEVPIILEGEHGVLPHLMRRVEEQGHAVVVVAEGAGEELLGQSAEVDASGNRKLPAIGEFVKKEIVRFFRENGKTATVKYIDPSYMIRSVPANAADALYCMLLGQNAVHGAMAGLSGFTTGLVNNRMCLIPIPQIVATSPRVLNPAGRSWERVLSVTRQPSVHVPFDPSVPSSARTVI